MAQHLPGSATPTTAIGLQTFQLIEACDVYLNKSDHYDDILSSPQLALTLV